MPTLAEQIRIAAVRIIKSLAGKNTYTNSSKRERVFDGFGDCSSTVRKVLEAAGLKFSIGSRTDSQIKNRKLHGLVVDESTTGYPNEANLKIGDCLYFKGNIFHALSVGHVEMYTGPNETYGHGSGKGPTRKSLRAYCLSRISKTRRYFMAIRWAFDVGERSIFKGCVGADVFAAQIALVELDYDLGKKGADGEFGTIMLARVIQFQERAGLPVNGVLTAEGFQKLFDVAKNGWPTVPVTPPVVPAPAVAPYMAQFAVATADVNVRTGPSTKNPADIQLRKGASLMYDGTTQGGWYAVLYDGMRRWVSGAYAKLAMLPKYVVDLSEYDEITDEKLFCSFISFAIVRIGLRSKTSTGPLVMDKKAVRHMTMLQKYGIPFALYFYGRSKTAAGGAQEADAAMAWAKPYNPTGYAYDAEAPTVTHDSVQGFVDCIKAKAPGKYAGAYIGHHVYAKLKGDQLRLDFRWIPRYGKNKAIDQIDPAFQHEIHQYSSTGHIPGKKDNTDMNHLTERKSIEWFRGEKEA